VTTVVATDADLPTQTLIWSLSGGADAALFTIDASTGALEFATAPDHESPADADGNNIYVVTVQASDGAGGTATQTLSVTVTPVNDNGPVITSNGGGTTASVSIAENSTAVTTITATDADLPIQTLSFSITGGADAALFTVDAATGVLEFLAAPDYESPADADGDNVYLVTVQASDGAGGTTTQTLSVTVTPVNDNAPVITSNGGGATASVSVAENSTAVTTVTATDADLTSQTLNYSISGGADAARFTINASTGVLQFAAAPDYESLADADGNNIYVVTVQASDGAGGIATQTLSVTVTPVNDNAPVITSNGGGSTASVNVAESSTAVTTVVATDADLPSQTLSYSLSGGADAAFFTIDAGTGALSFTSTPDHESPADADQNNVYVVTVQVSDGMGGTATQTLSVTVTPVNDNAPVITGGSSVSVSVAENTTAVTTVAATDADLPTQSLSYSLSGGADAALFTIDAGTGLLSFVSAPVYENPADADGNNVYVVTVQVSDGAGGTSTQTLSVTVTVATVETPLFVGLAPTSSADVIADAAGDVRTPSEDSLPSSLTEPRDSPLDIVTEKEDSIDQSLNDIPAARALVGITPVRPGGTAVRVVLSTIPLIRSIDGELALAITEVGENPVVPETVSIGIPVVSDATTQQTPGEFVPLANFREQFQQIANEQSSESQLVAGAAVLTAGSLAIGYLVWAWKSGSLLLSTASSLPAWMSFDPLPVLDTFASTVPGPVDDVDDETLLSLVSKD
jgi:hypothetical protein